MWLLVLAMVLPFSAQDSAERHVRATEPRILALVDAGLSRSSTFRRLVEALNVSDVIVYVEPKRTRQGLGGYLAHHIVAQGDHRYLRIAVETQGSQGRLVPLLAHELQHAVEVAQAPEVRDAESLERAFVRLAVKFGCGGTTCYETQAAKDVEHIVSDELKRTRLQRAVTDRFTAFDVNHRAHRDHPREVSMFWLGALGVLGGAEGELNRSRRGNIPVLLCRPSR